MSATLPEPVRVTPAETRPEMQAIVYRLYDVGYAIQLDRAFALLQAERAERNRPVRGEAQAIRIENPPITVTLGAETIAVAGRDHRAEVSARIFDFGTVSLRVAIAAGEAGWSGYCAFGAGVHALDPAPLFAAYLDRLLARLGPAIERPAVAAITEDYTVFRIGRMPPAAGGPVPAEVLNAAGLHEDDIVRLLLNETRTLSPTAVRELLPHRFSYYADDLAIVSWNTALVVEPAADDTDVQYVLEFANAQLLQLRLFDAQVDAELPRIYDRVERARAGTAMFRRYAPLLARLQTLVADSTELMERVENSLKVTDDVYLARIYTAALEVFRWRAWRSGIDRKLAIVRETYEMLNGESQAIRAEALEFMIVVLIVVEIVLSLVLR